jgi:hypothetical protein
MNLIAGLIRSEFLFHFKSVIILIVTKHHRKIAINALLRKIGTGMKNQQIIIVKG